MKYALIVDSPVQVDVIEFDSLQELLVELQKLLLHYRKYYNKEVSFETTTPINEVLKDEYGDSVKHEVLFEISLSDSKNQINFIVLKIYDEDKNNDDEKAIVEFVDEIFSK